MDNYRQQSPANGFRYGQAEAAADSTILTTDAKSKLNPFKDSAGLCDFPGESKSDSRCNPMLGSSSDLRTLEAKKWISTVARAFDEATPFLTTLFSAQVSPEDAKDLAQETLLKVWRHIDRDGAATAIERLLTKQWFAAVARNVLIDFRRKVGGRGKKRRPRTFPLENLGVQNDGHPVRNSIGGEPRVLDGEFERTEWFELLQMEAGENVAITVELIAVYGCTLKEAANHLGVSVRSVERSMQEARTLVRRAREVT